MRQMAGDGEDQVMMFGIHDLDIGAKLFPEGLDLFDIALCCIFRWGQYAPAFVEQSRKSGIGTAMFGSGDGMGRDNPRAGKGIGESGQHIFLGRSDIADDRIVR